MLKYAASRASSAARVLAGRIPVDPRDVRAAVQAGGHRQIAPSGSRRTSPLRVRNFESRDDPSHDCGPSRDGWATCRSNRRARIAHNAEDATTSHRFRGIRHNRHRWAECSGRCRSLRSFRRDIAAQRLQRVDEDLRERRKRLNDVAQHVQGNAGANGQRRLLQPLAGLGAEPIRACGVRRRPPRSSCRW